ncbi:hypothetical protein [Synechococcus sp. LTW-R]|uniref:hypothetical protein n=1 Tax=Synechococcus sp. LTW-R TaxID=2751170 RepID=UPI00162A7FFD|nr:hypothetical protein [Synechococcus sp. LTW-R]QNG30716.1 hypothetical protein H0O22_06510 [Synechococcus sp. LTW-R]
MAPLRWGSLLLLAGALAGCQGTPLGDQLSRSFSAPLPATPASPPASVPATQAKPAAPAPAAKTEAVAAAPKPAPKPDPAPAAPRRSAPPAPYRVTIKLPAADPSAPAEVLTQALRAAGLAFEVETIERVSNGTTPTRSAAPDPR